MCPHCACSIVWMSCQGALQAGYAQWLTRKRVAVLVAGTILAVAR